MPSAPTISMTTQPLGPTPATEPTDPNPLDPDAPPPDQPEPQPDPEPSGRYDRAHPSS